MADSTGLSIQVRDGWMLSAGGIRRDRSGDLVANLVLANGKPVYSDVVSIATPAGRDEFAKAATNSDRPSASEINDALLELVPHALGAAQELSAPRRSQADELVALALDSGVVLFHTPDGDAYADVRVIDHRETWPVRSKGFRRWLARLFYETHDKTPGAQAMQDALGVIEGRAVFDGAMIPVAVRLASDNDAIYLDLGNADWQAIEVTPSGWRLVADPPVRFRRSKGMLALPVPEVGGSLDDLRPFLNVTDDGWQLIRAWLLQAARDRGPYPALVLTGEQGAAKSTTARVLRSLIDPSSVPLRRPPHDERDLMIAAGNAWTIVLDNLSGIAPWLSDALCTLATGGGYATRELYADSDEVLFNAQRPVMLTAIEDIVTRGDLMDRSLLVTLPTIADTNRRPEAAFWAAFEEVRPYILGALLDHVAIALRDVDGLWLERLPRMADFAIWVHAGLGVEQATAFSSAYANNRATAHDVALDGSLLAGRLRAFMDGQVDWRGTAGELLKVLTESADESTRRSKTWPKSPRGLSGQLRRIAPHLRAAGINIGFDQRHGHDRVRLIELERVDSRPSAPFTSSADELKSRAVREPDADGRGRSADGAIDRSTASSTDCPRLDQSDSSLVRQSRHSADDADGADDQQQAESNHSCIECGTPLYLSPPGSRCRACTNRRPS